MPRKKLVAVIDAETDPFKLGRIPQAFSWDYFDGENHATFWGDTHSTRQLFEHLDSLSNPAIVFAHNGGKFDFHFLIPFLPDDLKIMLLGSRIAKLSWTNSRGKKIELRDSYLIIPTALKHGGDKLEIDYAKFEKDKRLKYKDEIVAYLKQDTEALYSMVSGFIKEFGLALTLANRAFNELKELGLTPPKGTSEFDAVFREFYFGGRCECFKAGHQKGKLAVFDINSAYPYAMTFRHAWGRGFHVLKRFPADDLKEQSFYIIEAKSKGALPRRKAGGGIHFPHCEGIFHATGWEVMAGIETETLEIKKILSVYVPQETQSLKPYVDKFFQMKLEAEQKGDTQKRLFAKILLNSAYGKFALNPSRFKEHCLLPMGELHPDNFDIHKRLVEICERIQIIPTQDLIDEKEALLSQRWTMVFDLVDADLTLWQRDVEECQKENRYYCVSTAASITGFVRAMLLRAKNQLKNPIYCDTDSFICEAEADLPQGEELGNWKIEASGQECWIGGKKLYAFECENGEFKTASKGVHLEPEEIIEVSQGKKVLWKNEAPTFTIKGETRFIERIVSKTVDIAEEFKEDSVFH
jgi:hypothetical protein